MSEAKFKVGQKVRVTAPAVDEWPHWCRAMDALIGRDVVIERDGWQSRDGVLYEIGGWSVRESWLTAVDEAKPVTEPDWLTRARALAGRRVGGKDCEGNVCVGTVVAARENWIGAGPAVVVAKGSEGFLDCAGNGWTALGVIPRRGKVCALDDVALLDDEPAPVDKPATPPAVSAEHHEQLRRAAGAALNFLSGLQLQDQPVDVQRECVRVVAGLMAAISGSYTKAVR